MWRRKPGFDICSGAGSPRGCRAHLVVARLYAVAVPASFNHSAECILPVVVSAAATATQLLAGHGMIDVAALHTLTTAASRGWNVEVGACGSQTKLSTANKLYVGHAEGGGDRDCVKVSPCVAAAETMLPALVPACLCIPYYRISL